MGRTFRGESLFSASQKYRITFPYGSWGLKFAASVVWRVLTHSFEHGHGRLTQDQVALANAAQQTWRAFLIGTANHPGRFEIHAFPLDVLPVLPGAGMSPFLNRYLLRATDGEVVFSQKEILVYAKLCRIMLVGHVVVKDQGRWRPSRLSVVRGTLGGRHDYYLPTTLRHYLDQCATRAGKSFASESVKQKGERRTRMEQDLPGLVRSEVFRAMRADLAQSGPDAFAVTGDLS